MTNDSDSFIQEVDESLRQDRAMQMLRRWGPYALGVVVAILVGVGLWQLWSDYTLNNSRRYADQFAAALEQAGNGDLDGAKAAFETMSNDAPRAYRLMARMEHAAILEQQGDLEAALREFDAVAEDATDDTMRGSAQIRAAYIAADSQDFEAMRTRLQPIIDRGGQVSFLAQELLGVEAWEAGQSDIARDAFENIRLAFDAPEAVRRRAEIALAVIGPDANAPAEPSDQPSEGEAQ
ncbi:MAG: tetratricopeptide repeat protein [Hyphomonadaceae bacterium]|nr:tetratricopeptide repeat protein [Hyphomonadaceae bacterium]